MHATTPSAANRAVTAAYGRWCAERRAAPLIVPFEVTDDQGHAFDALLRGPDRPDAVYAAYDPGCASRCSPRSAQVSKGWVRVVGTVVDMVRVSFAGAMSRPGRRDRRV
ncbi:hypothetical protein [Streptomyces sp. NPDC003006]